MGSAACKYGQADNSCHIHPRGYLKLETIGVGLLRGVREAVIKKLFKRLIYKRR
jgi:hypothetical protein